MAVQQIFEGTWEDLMAQSVNFEGKQLRLVMFDAEPSLGEHVTPGSTHFYKMATPEEFARAFDNIGAGNESLPVLPPEAFERESLYEESL